MAGFFTNLQDECVDDLANSGRGIWKVLSPLSFQSDILDKTITVEPGFLTDYASVPRVPILYWLFGDTSHQPAVIHDWLYHHHEVCDEATANLVFFEAMKAEGIPTWRRYAMYLGVKFGGRSSWEEDGKSNGHSIVAGKIV
jgi:hypothetical protein